MSLDRRDFLNVSAAAAAVLSLGKSKSSYAAEVDDIRVAQIGVRGQGNSHLRQLGRHVVAICDVDEKVSALRAAECEERNQLKPDLYVDYRKLLERNDIDAVSIATPNHTHAIITIAAIQAGKHVYCEKPASHNIWEGRQMVAAARKYNRVVQCGTQSRSSRALKEAAQFVHSGGLGKIQYAVGTCYKPRTSIGKLDEPLQIPSSIHYDLWCGPAEKREIYRPHLHYDWHWDFNTGNGDLGNQGIHQMDIARWFLGHDELCPRCISLGGRVGYEDAGDTPNSQVVYLDYPSAPLIFEVRGLPRSKQYQRDWDGGSMDKYRGSQIGVIVQCEDGHLYVPSNYRVVTAYDRRGDEIRRWRGDGNHHGNWLAAVAAGDASQLNSEIREGHLSSALCNLGCISHRLGEKANAGEIAERVVGSDLLSNSFDRLASHLRANDVDVDSGDGALTLGAWLELDPATERFTNNDQANELLTRAYRPSFVVPDIQHEAATASVG